MAFWDDLWRNITGQQAAASRATPRQQARSETPQARPTAGPALQARPQQQQQSRGGGIQWPWEAAPVSRPLASGSGGPHPTYDEPVIPEKSDQQKHYEQGKSTIPNWVDDPNNVF